jgi:hypothetical protein
MRRPDDWLFGQRIAAPMTRARVLLITSCSFLAVILSLVGLGVFYKTERQIAWCEQQGYVYTALPRTLGKIITLDVVCLDDEHRIVVSP